MGLNVWLEQVQPTEVYSANITHNLAQMAKEAGIYWYLWHPDLLGITKASELIEPLEKGLRRLNIDPEHFDTFNATNGWGKREDLVRFMSEYLEACREHPEAIVNTDT